MKGWYHIMLKKGLALTISAVLLAGVLAGCGGKSDVSGPDSSKATTSGFSSTTDHSGVTGTVKVAVPEWNITDMQVQIGDFLDAYPNVDVEYETFSSEGAQAYLTAQAQTKSLPDILVGDWGSLPFSVSQGWVKPLNEFLDKDEEAKYIPASLLKDYTYMDKIYALPMDLQFQCIAINLDLLDELNLEKPDYDWTIEEYTELLKAATSTKTSGTERLWGFDSFMTAALDKNVGYNTYDAEARKFNFSSSWAPALKLFSDLRAVPGLEAWTLRNSNVNGDKSDYTKKFGDGDVTDMNMAFKSGKVLTESFMLTSDSSWMRYMNFEWEMYPLPQDKTIGCRQNMHANHAFMLEGAQSPDAAYELLKWLTFGAEGNVKKMEMYARKDGEDVTTGYLWYIPSTQHPDVIKAMEQNEHIQGGIRYMYDHMATAVRADLYKIVPGYEQVNADYIEPIINEAREGRREAAAVAAEMDEKANKQLANAWLEFEEKLKRLNK